MRHVGQLLQRIPRGFGPVLVCVWGLFIWKLSEQPGDDGPRSFLRSWLWNSGHAPLFGLLAFWGVLSLPRENGWPRIKPPAVVLILLGVLLYAAVDEWHQAHAPGRVASVFDVATDLAGAACTLWIAAYLGRVDATGGGLGKRLGWGLGACLLLGLVATLGT